MSLFRFRWLHKFIRKRTKPIPEPTAALWKQRLSIIYMLSAWNALGIILYLYFGKKEHWGKYYGIQTEEELNKKPAVYYAELLDLKKVHVINVKGFKKMDEYDYEKPTENEEDPKNEENPKNKEDPKK